MTRILSLPAPTHRFALAVVLAVLATAGSAPALTLRVHPDSVGAADHVATLLEANALAAPGDSIEVSNAGSPYIQTEPFPLLDGVVYRGGFGPDFEGPNTLQFETVVELQLPVDSLATVIDANTTGSGTLFAGFTVTGGNASFSGGGIFCASGCSVEVRNCRFYRNFAATVGGGAQIAGGSSPTFYNCLFEENTAGLRGGGLGIGAGANPSIEFCVFQACSAATQTGPAPLGGGGIFTASGVTLYRLTVNDCYSGAVGGGLLTSETMTGALTVSTVHMNRNVAVTHGGAIYQDGQAANYNVLEINECQAGGDGGAFYFERGSSSVQAAFVRDCTAGGAGGAFYYLETSGSLLQTTEVVRNQALRGGGVAIRGLPFARSYSVEIRSNTFVLNAATETNAGGGIHVEAGQFLDPIVNNIISNQTDGSGITCIGAFNQPNVRSNCVLNLDSTNLDPEYGGDCDDRTGINGNLSAIPRFCDLGADPPQLGLNTFSPCVGSGEGGVNMGAHQGADCNVPVQVEASSWSRIKSYYR